MYSIKAGVVVRLAVAAVAVLLSCWSSFATAQTVGVSQFDGTYTGTIMGKRAEAGIPYALTFTVANGVFTATLPQGGPTGTVSASGVIAASAIYGGAPIDCPGTSVFTGQITLTSSGVAAATGTDFSPGMAGFCSDATSTWTATRTTTTPPNPAQAVAPPPPTQIAYTISTGRMPAAAVTTNATGTLGSVTLSVTLDLSQVLALSPGLGQFASGYNIYVVALVPGAALGLSTASWFVLPATHAWAALSSPIPAYMEGLAQNATNSVSITILQGLDMTGLVDTEFYIGYGTSDTEMLNAGRYRGVYKVQ